MRFLFLKLLQLRNAEPVGEMDQQKLRLGNFSLLLVQKAGKYVRLSAAAVCPELALLAVDIEKHAWPRPRGVECRAERQHWLYE